MVKNTVEPTEEKKLYMLPLALVDRWFQLVNLYPLGGDKPNTRNIARQHGCKLQFRKVEYFDPPPSRFLGIDEARFKTAAVLVGESERDLLSARREIIERFGGKLQYSGTVFLGREKSLF